MDSLYYRRGAVGLVSVGATKLFVAVVLRAAGSLYSVRCWAESMAQGLSTGGSAIGFDVAAFAWAGLL